ncbi:MAG: hypothetical protein J2P15_19370 [Micromonosporaceae bacterium]|nr:hypothetical protein [Micromonosporaceae bacterium]
MSTRYVAMLVLGDHGPLPDEVAGIRLGRLPVTKASGPAVLVYPRDAADWYRGEVLGVAAHLSSATNDRVLFIDYNDQADQYHAILYDDGVMVRDYDEDTTVIRRLVRLVRRRDPIEVALAELEPGNSTRLYGHLLNLATYHDVRPTGWHLYVADLPEVIGLVGSQDLDLVRRVVDTADTRLPDAIQQALGMIVDGSYTAPDPDAMSDDGYAVLQRIERAFEQLCRYSSVARATVKGWSHEEETPLLSEVVPLGGSHQVPIPRLGTLYLAWHPPQQAAHYRDGFTAVRASGSYSPVFLAAEELDSLIDVLNTAVTSRRGVLIFNESNDFEADED